MISSGSCRRLNETLELKTIPYLSEETPSQENGCIIAAETYDNNAHLLVIAEAPRRLPREKVVMTGHIAM